MQSPEYTLCWVEAHSGNPGGECTAVRKILESECLKAKSTIDATLGNKWPFCEILNEYFKKCSSGDNPFNPGLTRYVRRGQTLPGRQMWLLETMCQRMGVDVKLIDPTIGYWENKEEIERAAHVKLHLKEKKDNYELEALERAARVEERRETAEFEEYLRSMA